MLASTYTFTSANITTICTQHYSYIPCGLELAHQSPFDTTDSDRTSPNNHRHTRGSLPKDNNPQDISPVSGHFSAQSAESPHEDVSIPRSRSTMVQYKPDDRVHNDCNDYWKLGPPALSRVSEVKELLAKGKYYCQTNIDKKSVYQVFCRYQRGLLAYKRYNVANLRGFYRARAIPESQLRSRAAVAHALEKADDDPTFAHLFDLPPEIRDMIYGFYYGSHDTMHDYPSQPPLTKTSKKLRSESLVRFYKHCVFPLQSAWRLPVDLYASSNLSTPKFEMETPVMVKGITDKNFASIRRFFMQHSVAVCGRQLNLDIELDFSLRISSSAVISIRQGYSWRKQRLRESQISRYEKEIRDAVSALMSEVKPLRDGSVLHKKFIRHGLLQVLSCGVYAAWEVHGCAS